MGVKNFLQKIFHTHFISFRKSNREILALCDRLHKKFA